MIRLLKYYFPLVSLAFFSCKKSEITVPLINSDENLIGSKPLTDTVMKNMEGIYSLNGGVESLGTEFVCKVSKYKLSFFSNNSGIFIILNYGLNTTDSSIQFAGFWRYSESKTQGLINFSIAKAEGAAEFLQTGSPSGLIIKGILNNGNGEMQSMQLVFERPFSPYTLHNEFVIFAHHGVQTTADPPYTENSLNGAIHDQDYGVTGLEFDVHLTKDHVPICAHDASINIRVTDKGPISGNYIQYDFDFLEKYVVLTDGERIPSLEQVLNAFIDSTTLKYFWMDVKGDPDIFKYMEPIVRNAYAHAAAVNREVVIFADLPSQKVIDEYKNQPTYADLPTMCELELQDCIDLNCKYWGPRYSRGLLLDDVEKAHNLGIKAFSWTLNASSIITDYLQNGKFDGFITDYPAYVVYDYYTMF
ncbi:MAG TPA: glycerophosphodiester phosphodiesterase family protein [Puia sp.]|nr:glycerophosphodiester phosphodiesterase family protein [Puia sp.]